jgi:hypothetical protein
MDDLNEFFSKKHRERQLQLVSSCLLMAAALKRHNEDAALLLGDSGFQNEAQDLGRVLAGAESLHAALSHGFDLDPIEENELNMMWNRLRHQVCASFRPRLPETAGYTMTEQIEVSLSRINQRHH